MISRSPFPISEWSAKSSEKTERMYLPSASASPTDSHLTPPERVNVFVRTVGRNSRKPGSGETGETVK